MRFSVVFAFLSEFCGWEKLRRSGSAATRSSSRIRDWPKYTLEEPEAYERETLDTFFAACDEDEHLIYSFFLMTGMREQEVMYATWRCVDFHNNTISVKHNPEHGWTPKAYKERTIPVPQRLMDALKTWHAKRDKTCDLYLPDVPMPTADAVLGCAESHC